MNKSIPKYFYKKSNLILQTVFIAVFALFFIFVYEPFDSRSWDITKHLSDFQYFFYSGLLILVGVVVVAIGSTLLYFYGKKREVTTLYYSLLIVVEILLMSIVYAVTAELLGDPKPLLDTFESAFRNTTLILLLPFTISLLYFSIIEKKFLLNTNKPDEETSEVTSDQITFLDNKGEIRIAIQKKYFLYIGAADNYVYIYYLDKGNLSKFLVRNTMKYYEEQLSKYGIMRVHRSYIVNMNSVKVLKRTDEGLVLEFGVEGLLEIPCSKKYAESVIRYFSVN